MIAAMGVSREQFRSTCGVGAYLDDCTIVAPPRVAAIGLRAFRDAVATRGWAVNMEKTVCGVAYYVDDATEREEALRVCDGVAGAGRFTGARTMSKRASGVSLCASSITGFNLRCDSYE